jgi:hypothetical protein
MIFFDANSNKLFTNLSNSYPKQSFAQTKRNGSFEIYVAIGSIQVGTGKIRVLGEEDYPFYTMDVPLYRLVVADNLSGESGMTSYLVTRDAPVINVKGVLNGKNYNIINTAFEPAIPQGSYYLRARGITQSEVVWSALQS